MFKYFLCLLLTCSALYCNTTAQTCHNADKTSNLFAGPIYRYTTLNANGIGDFNANEGGVQIAYEYLKLGSFYAKVGFECEFGTLHNGSNKIGQQD